MKYGASRKRELRTFLEKFEKKDVSAKISKM
jgi:hypothetical protein